MTSAVRPKSRHVIIGGRCLSDLIRSILEQRVGFVADIMHVDGILAGLMEEYFYGGSFKDDFYEALALYGLPTDMITMTRKEIIKSMGEQIESAFGKMNQRNQYSFRFIGGGDVLVSEAAPWPVFGDHIFGGDHDNRNLHPGHLEALC